jgi:hypothetical protein
MVFAQKPLFILTLFFTVSLASCSQENEIQTKTQFNTTAVNLPTLDVYKNPSCGCCKKWINHINGYGFQSTSHNRVNLNLFKKEKNIQPRYRSCHTAVSEEGYVFEGHVPAKYIKQFLLEKPNNSIGLSVPAMPIGTPGMEVEDKFMPYQILLLNQDGSSEIYAVVKSYKEQF